MLELYQFNNSVCSQKVRITLCEKGLPFETRNVDLFTGAQYDPEYIKLNPKAYVPTLVDNGRAVCESTLICEYLDDAYPDPPLKPAEPLARADMRLWGKVVDEGLHVGVTMLSFSAMFRDRMKAMSAEQREERYRNVGDPARRDRFISTFEHGVESPYVFQAIAAYETAFKSLADTLEDGRQWIAGGEFSLAEINLAPYAARLEYLTLLDVWISGRPAIAAWWDRVKARPSYVAAIVEPLPEAQAAEMAETGARIRARIAERHGEYLAGL